MKHTLAWSVLCCMPNEHGKSQNCKYRCCHYLHYFSPGEPVLLPFLTVQRSEIEHVNSPACPTSLASTLLQGVMLCAGTALNFQGASEFRSYLNCECLWIFSFPICSSSR